MRHNRTHIEEIERSLHRSLDNLVQNRTDITKTRPEHQKHNLNSDPGSTSTFQYIFFMIPHVIALRS